MALFVVERTFERPPSDADLAEVAARERPCKEIHGVTWKGSFLSTDRVRMICVFEAADAESVRKVQREAEAPFDRMWPANALEPKGA